MHPSLRTLIQGCDLDAQGTCAAIDQLIGAPEDPVSAAILTAWTCKGETGLELASAAKHLMPKSVPLPLPGDFIDTCGTGGDGMETFNISTATALVVAGCGVRVVKHGNRAVSSRSGSADVLGMLGVRTDAPAESLSRQLDEVGVVFCLAPQYHPALAGVGALRRKLGFRSLFNALGPLMNPARATRQVIGVGQIRWLDTIARAASLMGKTRVCVVRGLDGLDEVTLSGPTVVKVVEGESIRDLEITPGDLGLPNVETTALAAGGPEESAQRIEALLRCADEPAEAVVMANTALALWTAGRTESLHQGVEIARRALETGAALRVLERWRAWSRGIPQGEKP
jgi:anthranilate phosphoribosyltransferase